MFLTNCNIISEQQYGFRPGQSTSNAIVDFIYNVLQTFKNNETIKINLDKHSFTKIQTDTVNYLL